ncbi:unnamed protein product [Pylaiella littoralis]
MVFYVGGREGKVAGASGRAAPRGVLLEGSCDSRASVSNRFYPEESYEEDGNQRTLGTALPAAAAAGASIPTPAEDAAEWRFPPLSPDALSGFAKYCSDQPQRDREIHDATSVMVKSQIPAVAEWLKGLPVHMQSELDLAVQLHRHGVNIRHLGKVRGHVSEEEPSVLRNMMLTEMVARTLKNILRSFQRKWMKAERSTSEQGMRRLVVNFLNLVTGAHVNSASFWKEQVLLGVLQRFGLEALTFLERKHFWNSCIQNKPDVLKQCVFKLTEMQGLVLTTEAEADFSEDCGVGFKFVVSDIQEIRPIVRYMHILDYGGGVMLNMEAEMLEAEGEGACGAVTQRTVNRLNCRANQHFIAAHQSYPDDVKTRLFVLSYTGSKPAPSATRDPPPSPQHPIYQPPPPPYPKPGTRTGFFRGALSCVRSFWSAPPCTYLPGGTPRTVAVDNPQRRSISNSLVDGSSIGASTNPSERSNDILPSDDDLAQQMPTTRPGEMAGLPYIGALADPAPRHFR